MARFYFRIEPDPRLLRGYTAILDAIDIYYAIGDRARAAALDAALQQMFARVDLLAKRTAVTADNTIRARIAATQKRPSTPGPHMRDHIHSVPLPSTVPGGAVGIANLDELDKVVNPRTGGAYWLAQEIGTGRTDNETGITMPSQKAGVFGGPRKPVLGFFQPGDSRANESQFRVHPYFQQEPYRKGIPAMVVRREIQPRHFLRDGAEVAYQQHGSGLRSIEKSALTRMDRIAFA